MSSVTAKRLAAILDVDGTLVDSNYHHALAWYRAFREHDIVVPLWRLHRHVGMGGEKYVAAVAGDVVERDLGDELRARWERLFDQLLPEIEPLDGAYELMAQLKDLGHPIVLASSAIESHFDAFVDDKLDARELADAWTTKDDVEASKPDPELVRDAVMINCNPETVSTDYDTSDRLYFEPLTAADVLAVCEQEKPEGVIVQFGGQTPLKLARTLEEAGVPLLGTPVHAIHLAEDRGRFGDLLRRLGVKHPPYGTALSAEEATEIAKEVGFPLLVRPSYVLGGRAMEICYSTDDLSAYLKAHVKADQEHPLLLDRFLENAIEVDVDALADGSDAHVAGIMQHVEEAGVHSGDSACVIPPMSLGVEMLEEIRATTKRIALELGVIGLINIQYAVAGGELYVIEANPRASRTVPFVSKATGVPLAKVAARLMLGEKLADQELREPPAGVVSVKEAVLPFARFSGADSVLGPEMKSTGEVMGIAADFPTAFGKAQAAAGVSLPTEGSVFITVTDTDKPAATQIAARFHDLGFELIATGGTAQAIAAMGVPVTPINKIAEGSPHVVELIRERRCDLVINTPTGSGARADGYEIRTAAVRHNVPCVTTMTGATAAVRAIAAKIEGDSDVRSLQEIHGLERAKQPR